jgi:hypothetical protein
MFPIVGLLAEKYWALQVFKLNVNKLFCWQAFLQIYGDVEY